MGTAYRRIESLQMKVLRPQKAVSSVASGSMTAARSGVHLADARLPEFFATDGSPIQITTDPNGRLSSAKGAGKDGVNRKLAISLLSGQVDAGNFIDRFVSLRTAFDSSDGVTGILTISLSLMSKQMIINAVQVDGPQLKYVIDFSAATANRSAAVTRTVSFDGSIGYSQHGSLSFESQQTDLPLNMNVVVPRLVSGLEFFGSVFNYFGPEYWAELDAVWGPSGISPPDGLNALYDLSIPQKTSITKVLVHAILSTVFGAVGGALIGAAQGAEASVLLVTTILGAEFSALAIISIDLGDILVGLYFGGDDSTTGGGNNSNVAPSPSGNSDPAAQDNKLKPKKSDTPTG